ncbi:MAG: GTPase HflX [Chloroflexi bacterium]|nr:GTPase HflX [Chloroflexota bacterium]
MSGRKRAYSTGPKRERVCLVGAQVRSKAGIWTLEDSIDELAELARSAGANPVAQVTQSLNRPSPTYLGAGKIDELKEVIEHENIDTVVFDDELTPSQQRMLEDALRVKVIDRTALILDVFAQRARTREGQLQIELAQTEYLLPRLAGQWSHLERLGGGVGTRGPGETQIETDRRLVRSKLSRVKKEIEKVQAQRGQQRRRRTRDLYTVTLVGYTNAGKSALFNRLTSGVVRSRDRLFETLDTTTRQLFLPSGTRAAISDTVGFIHKLPPIVVASFRATLEEALEADLLLHVVDVSSHYAAEQAQVVDEVLKDMGLGETPRILVLNKWDLIATSPDTGETDEFSQDLLPHDEAAVLTSATAGWGLDRLREEIDNQLNEISALAGTVPAVS